jgi:hypothetical protein
MNAMGTRTLALALGVQGLFATGCRVTATFVCERDDQCRASDGSGLCEANGFCCFADAECPSGRRYDDGAGQYAGVCTPAIDPPMIDAAIDAWSPSMCPSSYVIAIGATMSRYRVIAVSSTFWVQHAACNADLPGQTHLVVLDSMAEADGLMMYASLRGGGAYYAGVVQDPTANTPGQGWINFDGTPVVQSLWSTNQPSDANNSEADHAYQVAYFSRFSPYLSDYNGQGLGAICECDGKPVTALAQQYIDADPRNPN